KLQSEQAAGSVSKSTQFEYAWCLVRSKYNDDIRKGIMLLEELLPKGSKEEQRDYVFYLAVGNYRLKGYEKALTYVRGLLQTEPQNTQATELEPHRQGCEERWASGHGPGRGGTGRTHRTSCLQVQILKTASPALSPDWGPLEEGPVRPPHRLPFSSPCHPSLQSL
ncbi:Mitochondrial fission 1 protein, partial [Lemmus lemmus]